MPGELEKPNMEIEAVTPPIVRMAQGAGIVAVGGALEIADKVLLGVVPNILPNILFVVGGIVIGRATVGRRND